MFLADITTATSTSTSLTARDTATSYILSRGESIGLALDTEAGIFSAIAAAVILILVFYRRRSTPEDMDFYVINLFVGEVIQGVGHAMEMKWVIKGNVDTGVFCTAQGAMQQFGETGVALATLAIAVQTFALTMWNIPSQNRINIVASIFIIFQWLFVILFVGIAFGIHTHEGREYFATPTPYWCWIGPGFLAERIAGEYVWFWTTLLVSIFLYIPLFVLYFKEKEENTSGIRSAIVYPIAYGVMILPLSIVRWISFTDDRRHVGAAVTFIVVVIFTLSGVWNTLIYAITRTRLLVRAGRY